MVTELEVDIIVLDDSNILSILDLCANIPYIRSTHTQKPAPAFSVSLPTYFEDSDRSYCLVYIMFVLQTMIISRSRACHSTYCSLRIPPNVVSQGSLARWALLLQNHEKGICTLNKFLIGKLLGQQHHIIPCQSPLPRNTPSTNQ
jgi:hypothetical protein